MNKSNSTRSKGGVFLYFYSYYLAIKLIRNWLRSRSVQIMKTSKASSESQPHHSTRLPQARIQLKHFQMFICHWISIHEQIFAANICALLRVAEFVFLTLFCFIIIFTLQTEYNI